MNWKQILAGAVSGFVAAFLVDWNAFTKSNPGEAFDWKLAFGRWVTGAISGAMAGLGMGQF